MSVSIQVGFYVVAVTFFILCTTSASLLQISANQTLLEGVNMTIWCNASGRAVEWRKDDQPLLASPPRITIERVEGGNRLLIQAATKEDLGKYECLLQGAQDSKMTNSTSIYLPPSVGKWLKSHNVEHGSSFKLDCAVFGHPLPNFVWRKDGVILGEEEEHVMVKSDGPAGNSTLEIEVVNWEDRAEYNCTATNAFGRASVATLVRVKDKMDALWPFLGIVAEVIILVVIIFCYERKRAKSAEDEDDGDTPAAPSRSTDSGKGSDVRQRK